ncbi:glycosyl hydrolase [Intrasporangium chromatireducens Q5-1]|uniref:Glycosyl hydrolase n=1 Tax=Intrasporangium chromatireducens Q5-1 TaxID=584657 RepID=W9GKS0_9MICO|nr:glycoside hydrolase family 15 protein [Intrasporangium chromatireducens]EWT05418.1 glycosyl hydrolase [Intrasporangium chromatireducens Q5-1]
MSISGMGRSSNGYAPLRAYAPIGDGRSVALVAEDGSIDWLAWPNLDSATLFAALLDVDAGGFFRLAPAGPCTVTRRYLPDTNVLETTFTTASGVARVVDALTLREERLGPARELQRRVQGVSGTVPMAWVVQPRFGYGRARTRLGSRAGVPVATSGADALAVCSFGAGTARIEGDTVRGEFETSPGSRGVVALCGAHQEPLVLPSPSELDARLEHTIAAWRAWATGRSYRGAWRDPVLRSALALKLLVHAPSGAVAAAATTSLPEQLGGERNWDYRFCWVRDAAFIIDALLQLGCAPEAEAYFWWLMQATQLTHPRLHPLYRLDGGTSTTERVLPLAGYENSRPVRIGNAAAAQQQLDSYGELLQCAWLYAKGAGGLDAEIGRRLAEVADLVGRLWRETDAGIWEVRSAPQHFTHSKMMCWVTLDRALALADQGLLPDRHVDRWRREADLCRDFIEQQCYSDELGSYTRFPATTELDASLLLGLLAGYGDPTGARWHGTVAAVRRELGHGPYLYRYLGQDGLSGTEGVFLSCSFWLAEALARTGSVAEARTLMDELVSLANDVGIYAEEIDPATGAFLGNLPQGLTHLALISAAAAIAEIEIAEAGVADAGVAEEGRP